MLEGRAIKNRGFPTKINGRTLAVAVTATVAVAAGALVYATTRDSPSHPPASHVAAPVQVAEPPTSVAPKSVAPSPTLPAVPHERVASSVPTAFRISGAAFTIKADVCQMANVRPLNPPGDQLHTVCWVNEGFGVAPGSHSGGTSYILGHAWAEAKLVFNPLSEFAMRHVDQQPRMRNGVATYRVHGLDGYRITLRTRTGVLTYAVRSVFTVAKNDAAEVHSLMAERTPDRIVLITCGVHDGVDVDVNVIVYAYLTSSRAVA